MGKYKINFIHFLYYYCDFYQINELFYNKRQYIYIYSTIIYHNNITYNVYLPYFLKVVCLVIRRGVCQKYYCLPNF